MAKNRNRQIDNEEDGSQENYSVNALANAKARYEKLRDKSNVKRGKISYSKRLRRDAATSLDENY